MLENALYLKLFGLLETAGFDPAILDGIRRTQTYEDDWDALRKELIAIVTTLGA